MSTDLGRVTAAQYLAEGVLREATEGQVQEGLFDLLLVHLRRLEEVQPAHLPARLVHGLFQLLTVGGVAPEVYFCTVSHRPISAEPAGFSIEGGGLVALECLAQEHVPFRLDTQQVVALQLLTDADLTGTSLEWSALWVELERMLRRYLEFHFEQPMRSAQLLELCFEQTLVPGYVSNLLR